MKIPPQPPPIQVPDGARRLNVEYTGPVLQDEVIGHIPHDSYSVLMVDLGIESKPVVRPQPQLDGSGKPKLAPQVTELDLRPYSQVGRGLTVGAISSVVGGIVGAVVGYFAGDLATFAMGGAVAGAVAGAAWGAHSVKDDKTTAEWQLSPVVKHELNGYSHTAIPHTTYISNGKDLPATPVTTGYTHTYSPRIREIPVGEMKYWQPVVRHSSDQK